MNHSRINRYQVSIHQGVVVLTGASGGIGQATAQQLATAGFTLALVGRSTVGLEQALEQVHKVGGRAATFVQDLTQYDQLPDLVQRITTELGPITGLVNNAGIVQVSSLATTSLTDWERVIATNLTAVFALTQQIIPHLKAHGEGVIVNLASVAGLQTFPEWGAYCASKFGLVALSRTLAQELKPFGIRVMTLCPGAVDTDLWETFESSFDRTKMLSPESVAQLVTLAFTLPPTAVLEEVRLMPSAGTL